MAWHAVRAAGESLTATRRLLEDAPIAAWVRLSILVSFVGTVITPFLVDFNRGSALFASVPETAPIVGIAAVLIAAALCVGAVFEFVFLDALRGESVRLLSGSERWFRAGMQVFAFRAALAIPIGTALAALALFDLPSVVVGGVGAFAVTLAVLDRLTVAFVVPTMLVEGCSLPAGWQAFSRTLRAEWREYAIYLWIAALIWAAVAVVGGLLAGLLAFALLVPFGALGVAVESALLAQGLSEGLVGRAVLGTLAGPYLLAFVSLVLLIHVPLIAYLRYIALFVLGDTAERYDPIPQVRAAIRRG